MNNWVEMGECSVANGKIGETLFKAAGDWSMTLYRKEK